MILLALALIFLPMIFDGEGSYEPPLTSRIPSKPPVAPIPEPVQIRPVIIADSLREPEATTEDNTDPRDSGSAADSAPITSPDSSTVSRGITTAASTASTVAASPADQPEVPADQLAAETNTSVNTESETRFSTEPPSLGPDGLPKAWSIRLGTFSNAANAADLMLRLQGAGYNAYERSVSSIQGELTGVFVGPWMDRQRVENYQQELQTRFQLDGLIERYRVGEQIRRTRHEPD